MTRSGFAALVFASLAERVEHCVKYIWRLVIDPDDHIFDPDPGSGAVKFRKGAGLGKGAAEVLSIGAPALFADSPSAAAQLLLLPCSLLQSRVMRHFSLPA